MSAKAWKLAAFALLATGVSVRAAVPYTEATVTRVQNKVNYGEQKGPQSVTRPAVPQDVVRARNFLLSESDSRAELQYPDGTIVRIGQNTVFSFDADTRTLSLTKGSFIFYVPHGQGGATIKTPSLTAAITGTVGFGSSDGTTDKIGFPDGSGKLLPSGVPIPTMQYAYRTANGPIYVVPITGDWFKGVLWTYGGPFQPFRYGWPGQWVKFDLSPIVGQETLYRTMILPGSVHTFFPQFHGNPPQENGNTPFFIPQVIVKPPPKKHTPPPTTSE